MADVNARTVLKAFPHGGCAIIKNQFSENKYEPILTKLNKTLTMKKIKLFIIALAGIILPGLAAYGASNDTLLILLVKKGIITQQEADSVKADLAKEESATANASAQIKEAGAAKEVPMNKVVTNKVVDKLTLYGDW